ncbi:response regulator transcription factor [Pseudooceanicola aestuarii]|uniref:response regulator transcription factor n=1 Tax=Pseudooceanicola aestuarii TaxID=2697319 RepID=UPI0013D5E455|nr:response regulator transcription factor [Pseudooceanicola aestuarii]
MRILLVEDARDLAEATVTRFRASGLACDHADCIAAARDHLAVQAYDAVVLDINLPDGSGTGLLREMRGAGHAMPVLMLTAQISVDDKLSAFSLGADDYLVKPFDQRELEARLHVMTRRAQADADSEITLGGLRYDPVGGVVRLNDQRLELTRRELALLGLLMRHRGQVLSKDRLLEGLYSFEDAVVGVNAIELYVARLRRKITGAGVSIRTLRGQGYALESDG